VSHFHCSCGFAIDLAEEFGDHMHQVFARDDDIGTDGRAHRELADADRSKFECACGYVATDTDDLDDHFLMAFVTPDGIGADGEKHVPVDPSTPDRWYVGRSADDQ
jgi:hypothetical protein